MPRRAPSICTYPGCYALVRGGSRCAAHPYPKPGKAERQYVRERERARGRARRADKDDNYHFYYSRRWRKLRAWFIRANPLCDTCKERGISRAAVAVDHIIPISRGGAKFDVENLQSLCKACHTAKTNRERGGGGSKS